MGEFLWWNLARPTNLQKHTPPMSDSSPNKHERKYKHMLIYYCIVFVCSFVYIYILGLFDMKMGTGNAHPRT
jgi:hypothetical protein